jgi:hypothetical protein
MEQKNIEIILSALAEKISELELEVSLRDYDNKKLKEENETLKLAVENLKKAFIKGE